jgi:hypothetical protein
MIFQCALRCYFRWQCDDKIAMILPFPSGLPSVYVPWKITESFYNYEILHFSSWNQVQKRKLESTNCSLWEMTKRDHKMPRRLISYFFLHFINIKVQSWFHFQTENFFLKNNSNFLLLKYLWNSIWPGLQNVTAGKSI